MPRTIVSARAVLLAALMILAAGAPALATSRIKDLANIEGVRQNQLIGYGLVVGLNGTGDTLNNIPFTKQSLQAMLERLGVNIRGTQHPHRQCRRRHGHRRTCRPSARRARASTSPCPRSAMPRACRAAPCWSRRCSAPTATSMRWPRARSRSRGFQAEGEAAKITRGVPTVGRIANGAIIEREIEFALNRLNNVRLALRNPDFTTAKRIAAAINDFIGAPTAEPLDPSTVQLTRARKNSRATSSRCSPRSSNCRSSRTSPPRS